MVWASEGTISKPAPNPIVIAGLDAGLPERPGALRNLVLGSDLGLASVRVPRSHPPPALWRTQPCLRRSPAAMFANESRSRRTARATDMVFPSRRR